MWFGYGASGRRIREGVVEKLGETVQGVSKEGEMVLVGPGSDEHRLEVKK